MKKVFISYSWSDTEFVELLDRHLLGHGINATRDVRDLEILDDLPDFMSQVQDSDLVILVISKPYLESRNCLYEMMRLVQSNKWNERVFPIVLSSASLFDVNETITWQRYWRDKYQSLVSRQNEIDLFESANLVNELKAINLIRTSLDDFLQFVRNTVVATEIDVEKNGFSIINKSLGLYQDGKSDNNFFGFSVDETQAVRMIYDANILLTAGRATDALDMLRRAACDVAPNFLPIHINLANLLYCTFNDPQGALLHYKRAIEIDERNPDGYSGVGIIYKNNNKIDDAEKYLKKALAVSPLDFTTNNAIGELYSRMNMPNEAIRYFNLAANVSTKPSNKAMALNNKANQYQILGKLKEAEETYEESIKTTPKMGLTYFNYSLFLAGKNDIKSQKMKKLALENGFIFTRDHHTYH